MSVEARIWALTTGERANCASSVKLQVCSDVEVPERALPSTFRWDEMIKSESYDGARENRLHRVALSC